VPEGAAAAVGTPIAIITEKLDEDLGGIEAGLKEAAAPAPSAAAGRAGAASGAPGAVAAPPPEGSAGRAPIGLDLTEEPSRRKVIASPLAFRMAAELGLDLSLVQGTGPNGRVTKRDIEKAAAPGASAGPKATRGLTPPVAAGAQPLPASTSPAGAAPYEDVALSSMRKIIGARLAESKATAPHFYVTMEVDMEGAAAARERLNGLPGVSISFNDMIVKAVAICLIRNPALNASWQGDFIRYYRSADVGVAVAIPDGLVTPVVRACQAKTLSQVSEEVRVLAERARQKKLAPEEYRGGTFTVSNLGMYGVEAFSGIINPPESALLAVGGIRSVPAVKEGAVVPSRRMTLTLSCDHRVVDGAQAAQFLKDLKEILENPLALAL
jgi:pyruvate dehydrogenase E2 component (dihydrolipoamide acetyltransferase)